MLEGHSFRLFTVWLLRKKISFSEPSIAAFSSWTPVLGDMPSNLPWKLVHRGGQSLHYHQPPEYDVPWSYQDESLHLHICTQLIPETHFRHNFLANFMHDQELNKTLFDLFLPQNKTKWMHQNFKRTYLKENKYCIIEIFSWNGLHVLFVRKIGV